MEKKRETGHLIVTYKVRLYDRHLDWLYETKELYAKVVKHFFLVLAKEKQLLEFSDFLLLRELEILCIGTKEMKANHIAPNYPLMDVPKIPLYFRRSAINTAIALARKQAETIQFLHLPMTLYKGMYQNFTETSIEWKLFTGEKWRWVIYPFSCSRPFPKEARKMSPSLVLKSKEAWLNVPLSFEICDIRTIKERMEQEEYICAVSFPDYHVMAAAVILSKEGVVVKQKLFLGGKQKEHQRKRVLEQIGKSQKSRRYKKQEVECTAFRESKNLYQKLHEINNYYAQSISCQIVEYCVEQGIKVIVVPNYEETIDFSNKKYMSTDNYRWIGRSIIKKLKYKAFLKGIVVTSIRPHHISDTCSECGSKIKKYNEGHRANYRYFGGKLFLCPNGHSGNAAYNAAKNIGKMFLTYWT